MALVKSSGLENTHSVSPKRGLRRDLACGGVCFFLNTNIKFKYYYHIRGTAEVLPSHPVLAHPSHCSPLGEAAMLGFDKGLWSTLM